MNIVSNINIITVGIAIAAIGILGFIVYFNNRQSVTNKTFLIFTIMAILWNGTNYLGYEFESPVVTLWILRLQIFFAVWYCYFLFRFFLVFPEEKFKFSKIHRFFIIPFVIFTAIVTLTPYAITQINKLNAESEAQDVTGLGMILFGVSVLSLIVSGIVVFLEKRKRASVKTHYNFIIIGTAITFSLYIVFNFILPVFLQNITFMPFGAVYTFPFIAFTSYVIIKHRFLGVKVISTEILVFILSIVTLFELAIAQKPSLLIFRSLQFILVLIFGVLLIRSVIREVKQREQLEILSKKLEEANKQLKILDQARSEFITIASHQLRTPPATIKWYLASILDGDFGQLPKEAEEQLRKTQWTNDSLISLIDDLLNVSRIERGKLEFAFEPTDILKLTQMTVDQLLPQALNKKLKLTFQKPADPMPQITADKEKLRQVINNFIDNAIKYTKEGQISVELSKTAKDVVLKVTDTGRGVKPQMLKSIFEKFDRGKEAAKNSTGLGLGLYVAKVIIEQHNGKIWVESKGEGKGSTFNFTIPIQNKLTASTFDLTKTQKLNNA